MGLGRYKDGKFDLIISMRHDADETRIDQWERSFKRASEILFDATDGQTQFGKLFVANNSAGTSEADAWLLEEEGTSSSSVDALGTANLHMNLKSDEKNKPFIIIHEFGHYGLGLYDEYIGPSGSAECTGGTATGACIMEHGYWDGDQIDDDGNLTPGTVNEFCCDDNHDPDNDTYQQSIHEEACWQTIQDNYPDVEVPTGLPDAPIPSGHEEVEWILLAEEPIFALVLDRSGSMSAHNAISGVRYGAHYWVNYLAQTGDNLSVIAYNHAQSVILPLTPLTGTMDLTPILTSINGITPDGTTNIGGAMQNGVGQITSPGEMAATQVMILFSDGLHNTGTPPEAVISSLVENGIRTYTIGFGPYADQVRLQQIAEATGGRFEQIDADPDTPDAELEIQNYLIEVSGEVRDGSGIITMMPGLLPEPSIRESKVASHIAKLKYNLHNDLEFIEKFPFAFRVRSTGFDHKAFIEEGSTKATFVASYKEGTALNFYLVRPNGRIVNPAADSDVKFINPFDAPYAFYIVNNPKPGFWTMRVTRGQALGEIPFKVFAFSENKNIAIGIKGIRQKYNTNDLIKLGAQVFHKIPLTNISHPVIRVMPQKPFKTKLSVGRPTVTIPKLLTLQQRFIKYDSKRQLLEKPITVNNGVYEGEICFDKPGSYSMVVQFVNQGKAVEASPDAERPRKEDQIKKPQPVPQFVRVKHFQIHVGQLPKGEDVEAQP